MLYEVDFVNFLQSPQIATNYRHVIIFCILKGSLIVLGEVYICPQKRSIFQKSYHCPKKVIVRFQGITAERLSDNARKKEDIM